MKIECSRQLCAEQTDGQSDSLRSYRSQKYLTNTEHDDGKFWHFWLFWGLVYRRSPVDSIGRADVTTAGNRQFEAVNVETL